MNEKKINRFLHPFLFMKLRREKIAIQEKLRIEKLQQEAEKKLTRAREELLNSLCSINNKQNCFAECSHFKEGYIGHFDDFDGTEYAYFVKPQCKLWQKP